MKILKPLVLGIVFLFGLTVMADEPAKETSKEAVEVKKAPCSTVFTICDYAQPDSHDGFVNCMVRNGC